MAAARLITSARVEILEVSKPRWPSFNEWAIKVKVDDDKPKWIYPGDHVDVTVEVFLSGAK